MSFRACTGIKHLLASSRSLVRTIPGVRHVTTGPQSPASNNVISDHGLESVRDMFELKNKNFVVTGGGRGIGYAITRAIAEMGGNVAVLDVLDKPVKDWETLPQQIDGEFKLVYIKLLSPDAAWEYDDCPKS
jgi:FlaA1/EpsC-like NDP-sugar epimerase